MDAGLDLADRVTALARTEYWRAHRIHARSFFDRRKEAAVLDYARRHGRENFLTMAIPLGPLSRFQWTSLYRARAGAAYDDDEVRACEALMPHFTEAFQINQAVSGSARPVAGETAMSGNAIALADPRGHLLHQERRFLDLLSQEWAALDTPRLPRPVVESRAFSSGGRIEGRKIVVTVRRSIGLIILYARSKRRIELLPRQRATAVRLYSSGRTSKEIARRMQLSPATVRNHLAAAYRDLGIGSRTELCDLIASEAHSDPVD
ncbi:MAG: response regulator transcription factor [Lautropia sp.]